MDLDVVLVGSSGLPHCANSAGEPSRCGVTITDARETSSLIA